MPTPVRSPARCSAGSASLLLLFLLAVPPSALASDPDPGLDPAESAGPGAPDPAPGSNDDPDAAPIAGGSITEGWPAVVALADRTEDGAWPFCTGTLIAPDAVLTAAHCLEDGLPEVVYFGHDPLSGQGENIRVVDGLMHPDYSGEAGSSGTGHDLALVWLARDAAPRPVSLAAFDTSTLVGEDVVYVGFGETQGSGGEDRKKVAHARISDVYEDVLEVVAGDGSACFGDSGGPVFYAWGNRHVLVGVVSFGYSDDCITDPGGNARVDTYLPWIRSQVDIGPTAGQSGEAPSIEPSAKDLARPASGGGCRASQAGTRGAPVGGWALLLLGLVAVTGRRRD